MPYKVSTAKTNELDCVGQLINNYVRQNLNMSSWQGSIETLKRDYASGCFRMNVVYSNEQLVGFAAWTANYDLHHCTHGAVFLDFYVDSTYRCQGLGAALICAIADEITHLGWTFMRGQAISGRASRLYERVGICFGTNEYNVSGKALRQLASLAGKSAREIFKGLPTKEMNYQN